MIQKLVFFLLFSINIYAQSNFVKVDYLLKIGYDESFSNGMH